VGSKPAWIAMAELLSQNKKIFKNLKNDKPYPWRI
jgi:hypothetical protein